jgi:hypothetical protein
MGVFIPDTYGLATFGFRTGGPSANKGAFTLGYQIAVGSADPLTSALAIRSAWSSVSGRLWWPASYSSQTTFLGVRVMEHRGGGLLSADAAQSTAGTGAQDQMPPNCAILVKKITNIGGRHNQGRCFLPPAWVTEVSVTSTGALAAGDVITINGMLLASLTAMETAGYHAVLLHSTAGPAPVSVTALSVDGRVATQRRRLR